MLTGKELGAAIESARIAKGVSKKKLAEDFGVKPPSVQGWVNTGRIDKAKLMELIAYFSDTVAIEHWGISSQAFDAFLGAADRSPHHSTQEPAQQGGDATHKESNVHAVDFRQPRLREFEIDIPQYDVRAAMGAGQVPPEYVELVRHVVVDKRHLDLFGVSYSASGNLAMITGWGQSMADTIHHGEPVIVDRGVDRFIGDGVYVFTWDDLIYLKRLQKEPPARLKVISDNRNHDPFYIPVSEVIIHARVVMVWNARKV